MKWIVSCFFSLCLGMSAGSFAQSELLQLSVSHQQDTQTPFSGVDGLEVKRLETKLHMPLLARSSFAGDWFAAAQLTENRFLLSGTTSAKRRLYRFSIPIEYEASQAGRWQHVFQFAPTYFTDESLIDQTRYVNAFAWQVSYRANRKVSWVAGVRQDALFGDTQMYPIFGLQSKPYRQFYHHWVFPNIYSQVTLKKGSSVRLFMQPEGGNWQYRESDGSTANLVFNHWELGIAWLRPLRSALQLKLEVGLTMRGEANIAGADGELGDGYFFLVGLQSAFAR